MPMDLQRKIAAVSLPTYTKMVELKYTQKNYKSYWSLLKIVISNKKMVVLVVYKKIVVSN